MNLIGLLQYNNIKDEDIRVGISDFLSKGSGYKNIMVYAGFFVGYNENAERSFRETLTMIANKDDLR